MAAERKQTEEVLHNALGESQQRGMEISALLKSVGAVLRYREFKDAAQTIFDSCKNLIGATSGYVALLSKDNMQNEVLFLDPGGYGCAVDPSLPMPIRGLREEAYRTGKAVYHNHFLKSEWAKYIPEGHVSLNNVLFAPLVIEGKAVGLLSLANKTDGFTEHDAEMASAFAEIAAVALNNSLTLESLKNSEVHYRSLFENSLDGIYRSTPEGRFIDVNPALVKMFGYASKEELLSINIPKDLYFSESDRRTAAERNKAYPARLKRKDGTEIWVEINSWVILDGKGNVLYYEGITRDMTERKQVEEMLLESEARYRELFETSCDGIVITDLQGRYLDCNRAYLNLLGYTTVDELRLKSYEEVTPPEYHEFEAKVIAEQTLACGYCDEYEKEYLHKTGRRIPVSLRAWLRRDSNNQPIGMWIIVRDITERKRSEEQIKYLSFHDKLTSLYNRAYFEEELKRLDTERQLPLSLIMGDINGLKLVNDAFGHQEGDKLLIRIAQMLRNSCRKEDIIARWGGDEFAILLPRTGEKTALEVCNRIRKACIKADEDPIQPSIALGTATKDEPVQNIQQAVRESEDRMYRNKLTESKSTRHAIISSLERSLWETDYETEEHAERLQKLALQVGRSLKLTDSQLDELSLLAALHDIGKLAIPHNILMKLGSLSPEEWEVMRKHPEIGYHIAESSPDLAPISESILAHHERWDGTGYPQRLKGDKIPLVSRIVAIVDAYDVMTHERPYKKAVSQQEALEELKKYAGSQFDPELVEVFIEMMSSSGMKTDRDRPE